MIDTPRPASRYTGLRCGSVSLDGLRCEREAGHTDIRGRVGELHRAADRGMPTVWNERG
jgi:hypothetical protein